MEVGGIEPSRTFRSRAPPASISGAAETTARARPAVRRPVPQRKSASSTTPASVGTAPNAPSEHSGTYERGLKRAMNAAAAGVGPSRLQIRCSIRCEVFTTGMTITPGSRTA